MPVLLTIRLPKSLKSNRMAKYHTVLISWVISQTFDMFKSLPSLSHAKGWEGAFLWGSTEKKRLNVFWGRKKGKKKTVPLDSLLNIYKYNTFTHAYNRPLLRNRQTNCSVIIILNGSCSPLIHKSVSDLQCKRTGKNRSTST